MTPIIARRRNLSVTAAPLTIKEMPVEASRGRRRSEGAVKPARVLPVDDKTVKDAPGRFSRDTSMDVATDRSSIGKG